MPPLLLTSQNGPSGLGRAEAFWNSFSCDPSIAVLQSVPAFLLSQSSVGPRSSGEVARQHASARSNQRFAEPFSLPGTYSLPSAILTYTFAGLTFELSRMRSPQALAHRLERRVSPHHEHLTEQLHWKLKSAGRGGTFFIVPTKTALARS
jgi:hypothetical protein